MTAKPVQPAPSTLVDSLQSEVSAEASPLLQFLVTHAGKIALALLIFILAIGVYWFFGLNKGEKEQEEARALGQILIISDPAMRLERLEAFLQGDPGSARRSALFSIMEAATLLQDNDKVYESWKNIADFAPELKATATMGMVQALSAQEKYREALDLLTAIAPSLKGADKLNADTRIILLSEILGDIKQAIAACDELLNSNELSPEDAKVWKQKRSELQSKVSLGATKE